MNQFSVTFVRRGHRLDSSPALEVDGLRGRIGGRVLFENFCLTLFKGDLALIVGENGTGKSSLLNCLAGTGPVRIEQGRIRLQGVDVTHAPAHERACRGLSYLRQHSNVFPHLTIAENLEIAVGKDGPAQLFARLPALAPFLPLKKLAGLLSGGQRQMLAWGMATLRSFHVLIADEPEAGVRMRLPLPSEGALLIVSHTPQFFTDS